MNGLGPKCERAGAIIDGPARKKYARFQPWFERLHAIQTYVYLALALIALGYSADVPLSSMKTNKTDSHERCNAMRFI